MWQLLESIARGVDMFDCVIPTRLARNGNAFTKQGRYPVKSAEYKFDDGPIEEGCTCHACSEFTRGYIRHLLNVKEVLGIRLLTIHNIHRYMEFMREVRSALDAGCFTELRKEYRELKEKNNND